MADHTLITDSPGPSNAGPSNAAPAPREAGRPPVREPAPITGPPITGEQCRAARALLFWSQNDLARRARVSTVTIRTFERRHNSIRPATAQSLRLIFNAAGVDFIDADEHGGVGVCFAKRGR